MKRWLFFGYGLANYGFFFAVYAYLAGFVGNLLVPKSIDTPSSGPLSVAIAVNLVLLALFGLQHSVMARPGFKRVWTRIVPEPIERSTYVLFASACLALVFWQWRPLPQVVWNVSNPIASGVLSAMSLVGYAIVFGASEVVSTLTGGR